MNRSTSSVLTTAALLVPAGIALGGPGHSTAQAAASHAKTQKYAGATAEMRWGTVQVTIYVKNKKITNVKSVYDVHSGRSEFITGQALPLLRSEVLQAQNAEIDGVSRATDTSEAFVESLQDAVQKARQHKALKAA